MKDNILVIEINIGDTIIANLSIHIHVDVLKLWFVLFMFWRITLVILKKLLNFKY